MIHTKMAERGMVVAPHHLASQAGLSVLREGGNAIEAMVAAASTVAAVYPHMNAIGGDGFWLISEPGRAPRAISACGAAAGLASIPFYREQGFDAIPGRGSLAALTVAGTISGWEAALKVSGEWGGKLPLARLLEEAAHHARAGVAVSESQSALTRDKLDELRDVPGFAQTFLKDGEVPGRGDRLANPGLAATLEQLGRAGLDDFYRGDLAASMAADLERVGSPVRRGDLEAHKATCPEPLSTRIGCGTLYNMTPPTQGVASLMILGIFDRLGVTQGEGFDHIHGLVEATKQAFIKRNVEVVDPAHMKVAPESLLEPALLDELAADIDAGRALEWPYEPKEGDTVWMGVIDGEGRAVSFIQSIYWEFGAGVVLPGTGVLWQNRGISFSLDPDSVNPLMPGRLPFHTLNPALARLDDGRVMSYGTMGGEGQPQTQAAVFTRHVLFGQGLQQAVTAPRWLLGRTWGDETTSLKMEEGFDPALIGQLRAAGHDVETVAPFNDVMGHAGALVRHPDGLIEGASDPRSDGSVAAF